MIRLPIITALFLALAACSSNDPVFTGPAKDGTPTTASEAASLENFIAAGSAGDTTTEILNGSISDPGGSPIAETGKVSRTTRTVLVDGLPVVVSMDKIGDHTGLLKITRNGQVAYRIPTATNPTATLHGAPTGVYMGRAEGEFRMSADSTVRHGNGVGYVYLNSETGTGSASAFIVAEDGSAIGLGSEIAVENGQFLTNETSVLFGQGNSFTETAERATLEGQFIGTPENAGVTGLFHGQNAESGFMLNGGFTAAWQDQLG
ncbi:hypothetical protein ACEUZ9_004641 [Paracoccus litorisediminis]|uniref:hypothetical protein n=1 Tax=Paracoccus litorisediminis TaxID=2006130 RepID=UPI003734ADD4